MSVTDRSHVDAGRAGNQSAAGRAGNQAAAHEAWLPPEHPMYRPRHGGRQLTALICAGLFFLTPTFVHSVGIHAARFENRALATFGDPRDGWAWLTALPA